VSDEGSVSRNLFRLKPRLLYNNGDNLSVSAGLNIVYQNDTLSSSTALNLLPSVEGQYTLGESFTVFAGFDADVQRTALRLFVNENPWLEPNVPLAHTIKGRELYGGIKGRIAGDLSFAARLGYAGYKNMYFYTNSISDTSKFTLTYDPDFTGVINFSGELGYNAAEKFRLSAKVDFYNYNTQNEEEAWHRPKFTTTLLGKYNVNQKLSFNTEIYYLGGITAKNFVRNRKVELEPVVDVNVKADYAVTDRISAFLSLNNLLNRKYQRFLYYPNRGLTVMLGATYSF
jgi:outer membrane receptor protein involved in Fe transport